MQARTRAAVNHELVNAERIVESLPSSTSPLAELEIEGKLAIRQHVARPDVERRAPGVRVVGMPRLRCPSVTTMRPSVVSGAVSSNAVNSATIPGRKHDGLNVAFSLNAISVVFIVGPAGRAR